MESAQHGFGDLPTCTLIQSLLIAITLPCRSAIGTGATVLYDEDFAHAHNGTTWLQVFLRWARIKSIGISIACPRHRTNGVLSRWPCAWGFQFFQLGVQLLAGARRPARAPGSRPGRSWPIQQHASAATAASSSSSSRTTCFSSRTSSSSSRTTSVGSNASSASGSPLRTPEQVPRRDLAFQRWGQLSPQRRLHSHSDQNQSDDQEAVHGLPGAQPAFDAGLSPGHGSRCLITQL